MTSNDRPMVGTVKPKRGRTPKVFERGRVCAKPRCATTLNRYNRGEFCALHRPTKYPRMRR